MMPCLGCGRSHDESSGCASALRRLHRSRAGQASPRASGSGATGNVSLGQNPSSRQAGSQTGRPVLGRESSGSGGRTQQHSRSTQDASSATPATSHADVSSQTIATDPATGGDTSEIKRNIHEPSVRAGAANLSTGDDRIAVPSASAMHSHMPRASSAPLQPGGGRGRGRGRSGIPAREAHSAPISRRPEPSTVGSPRERRGPAGLSPPAQPSRSGPSSGQSPRRAGPAARSSPSTIRDSEAAAGSSKDALSWKASPRSSKFRPMGLGVETEFLLAAKMVKMRAADLKTLVWLVATSHNTHMARRQAQTPIHLQMHDQLQQLARREDYSKWSLVSDDCVKTDQSPCRSTSLQSV
jgi:hypothetical protein